jgi:hypothetical protein
MTTASDVREIFHFQSLGPQPLWQKSGAKNSDGIFLSLTALSFLSRVFIFRTSPKKRVFQIFQNPSADSLALLKTASDCPLFVSRPRRRNRAPQ